MEEKILRYNRKAIYCLNKGDHCSCLNHLTKAKLHLRGIPLSICSKLMAITLNNFGCYYKSLGLASQALLYIKQAIEIERSSPSNVQSLAATYLNESSLESQLGNHLQSLTSALRSIDLLKNVYKSEISLVILYLTAHLSAGIEHKSLKNSQASHEMFMKGHQIALALLGQDHKLTQRFEIALNREKPIKIIPQRLSPIKNARCSTAQRSIKKKSLWGTETRSKFSSVSRNTSRSKGSPLRLYNRLSEVCGNTIDDKKLSKTRKKFRVKKKALGKEVAVQAALQPESEIMKKSAILIQRAWRAFYNRKRDSIGFIEKLIKRSEAEANKALLTLQKLKSQKKSLQSKSPIRSNRFEPIPLKSKTEFQEQTLSSFSH